MDDNRAVAPVIGVVILFGFLILALSLYQVEIVPQQNAETEFQHSGEVRNDLVELRAGILQAGSIDQTQYQTLQLGTTYSTRVFSINPPAPAGAIRTSESYPITIAYESNETVIETIPTRFIEYQPGYNELDRSPTWYDASVLYLDARDEGGGIAVIEDQALVDGGEVQITALQREFRRSGTGRVTLELRPAKNVTRDIPEGDLTVTVPTRLSNEEYWDRTGIPNNKYSITGDANDDGVYNLTLNTTANKLTVDAVGVQGEPEVPTQTDNASIDNGGDGSNGTISTPSLTGTVEDLPTSSTPTQNITFSPTGSTIPAGETVVIDLSNANGPVDYENIGNGITTNFSGSLNTVNDGSTFAIEFTPSTNIATSRTIGVQIRSVPTQDAAITGIPVDVSRSDGDGFNTTFSLFDGGNGGGGGDGADGGSGIPSCSDPEFLSGNNFNIGNNDQCEGGVTLGPNGNIQIGNNAEITGDLRIEGSGTITMANGALVNGNIIVDRSLSGTIGNNAEVTGCIDIGTNNNVNTSPNTDVEFCSV
ncbi:hypothetical protein PN415_15195 [Halorubrum ezzemoulense]|nr:hypothetical protein [Halorubrum ezzemoulense]MDB9281210.1 hypothetical protein [Halorubrum ezzemoulense]